jgi:hypothetical protein
MLAGIVRPEAIYSGPLPCPSMRLQLAACLLVVRCAAVCFASCTDDCWVQAAEVHPNNLFAE